MVSYPTFYEGARYGLEPKYEKNSGSMSPFLGYNLPASAFGFPTNPQTANQIDAVSKKISTGAKTIEVSGVSIGGGPAMDLIDNIPKQQFKEIARLKKLAGVDLTFHGPLVEPTGVSRQGWEESQRKHVERQMFSAVDRAADLGKNTVVTFHASNGLPEPETYEYVNGKPVLKEVFVVDERNGRFQQIGLPKKDFLTGETLTPYEEVKKQNKESWFKQLQGVSFHANQGADVVERALGGRELRDPQAQLQLQNLKEEVDKEKLVAIYKDYLAGNEKKITEALPNKDFGESLISTMQEIAHGDIYLRDAYGELRNLYNVAYDAAQRDKDNKDSEISSNAKEAIKKLDRFKQEMAPHLKDIEDPTKIEAFGREIVRGVNILRSITPPRTLTPLRDFALDKASDTFGNVAFDAYKKYKGEAPIISIENPPVGMGMSSGNDLRDLVKASHDKFIARATKEGMSESAAREQAEKLIGVTWDVGHINMMRKHGAQDKQILEQTEKVAPFVKHIHLSDNFGLEHTELPMGMGNVPIKEHEEILKKQFDKKFKDIKQIVETGAWFRNFNNVTPFAETLEAFGSGVSGLYPMKMAASWNATRGGTSPYFTGYGRMLPDVNFSTYGAGFSSLPAELGGQVAGSRNRLSGAPME
jgi:sugar phosphate isomerase/epimerase